MQVKNILGVDTAVTDEGAVLVDLRTWSNIQTAAGLQSVEPVLFLSMLGAVPVSDADKAEGAVTALIESNHQAEGFADFVLLPEDEQTNERFSAIVKQRRDDEAARIEQAKQEMGGLPLIDGLDGAEDGDGPSGFYL